MEMTRHNTQSGIIEMDSSLFVTYTHSLGEEDTACPIGPHRDDRSILNKQGLWEAGFIVKRVGCPLALKRGCDEFVCWQGTETPIRG